MYTSGRLRRAPSVSTAATGEVMSSRYPFSIERVDDEVNQQLLQDFTGERTGFVQVGPEKYFFPMKFEKDAEHYYNFEVRSDDTWVVSFPRSGTTWTQELVWMLANNFDYERARSESLLERFPFLEFSTFVHEEIKREVMEESKESPQKQALAEQLCRPMYESLRNKESSRFIKTHLPFSLLPPDLLHKGCKVIYVARNPKDVAVSFYHLNRLIKTQGFKGDSAKYWDYFERNLQPWAPYWSHVNEAWNRRKNPNLLFLFYEEMINDLPSTVTKVAEFLQVQASVDEIAILCKHLDINNFRNNPSVNFSAFNEVGMLGRGEEKFIRKGKTGSWNDEFTPELNERANAWIEKHLQHTDLKFPTVNQETTSKSEVKSEKFHEAVTAHEIPAKQ